jgi:V/A-type H+-transporting ATPase subunit I
MLKPEGMTRAVVVGSIESLDPTIKCLYELELLHLIDFTKQDEEFKLGQPLSGASEDSQRLLKLRAMIRALEIEGHRPKGLLRTKDIDERIEQAMVTLDLNISSKSDARQKIQSLVREMDAEVKALEPVRTFGIPIENYDGYDNLAVFVGTCKLDPEPALKDKIKEFELFKNQRKADLSVAVFVKNDERLEASRILTDHGFQEIKLPKLEGDPGKILSKLVTDMVDLEKDLRRVEADIESIRKQFADFIIASEEHLSIEVLKAETPLKIAASANSFVIDGWIPTVRLFEIRSALESLCCGLSFVETVEKDKEEEPPVKLKNPKPIKPFEFFINLVSTPKYEEIDPTLVLFITFPLFFGFMIGDLGFGAGLMVLGAVIRFKLKNSPDLQKLGAIILAGGLLASIFGTFVFAEAFGVPFHAPAGNAGEASWANVVNIPIHPMMEKMSDVLELLALSFVAGWLHLTVGFIFGFFNNFHHNVKHALAKIAWLVILLGIFTELMAMGGNSTGTSSFMNSTVLAPLLPTWTVQLAGIKTAISALVLIAIGIPWLLVTEGGQALTEIIGLFTNLISYARLAALAVGKGAMAFAFNSMLFPLIFEGGSGIVGVIVAALGVVTLVVVQLFFVFFLGALSAGIQAMRLNYVEFFLKFFEGGGTDFQPLSYERKYSVATK